jgi:hypothetical protein
MRKMVFIMIFLLGGILTVEAQRNSAIASKVFKPKYKGRLVKEGKNPDFNKNDSSLNKKLSRQKRKENNARRKKAKSNSRLREMEVKHHKHNAEVARKLELKEREAKR